MNKYIATLILASAPAMSILAQSYYADSENRDMIHHADRVSSTTRQEFILPSKIGGYIPVRTDLHLHTYFSDGHVSPLARVREAWIDGLDAIAFTEHIEYHPADQGMIDYLSKTLPQGIKAHDVNKKPDMMPLQDLNYSVKAAQQIAPAFGMMIIPGTEITRNPKEIGHFNALFTTDNNIIYDKDPIKAIRNARGQGALVMHNHPGWRRTSIEHPAIEKEAYDQNLIDGIEVNNGIAFTPGVVDRARQKHLFVASTTDLHQTSAEEYLGRGLRRDMTIVLAKEKSLDGIKEALQYRRTIAYAAGGSLAGDEALLKQLFDGSVRVERIGKNKLMLQNQTSLNFVIAPDGNNQINLPPLSSIFLNLDKGGKVKFSVLNMWTGANQHPSFEL